MSQLDKCNEILKELENKLEQSLNRAYNSSNSLKEYTDLLFPLKEILEKKNEEQRLKDINNRMKKDNKLDDSSSSVDNEDID